MAPDTGCASTRRLVVMVLGGIVFGRKVPAGTERVALCTEFAGVRFVTVAAADALRVHPALEKRGPVVDLALLLSVGVIERRRQECREVVVEERRAGLVPFGDLPSPRM